MLLLTLLLACDPEPLPPELGAPDKPASPPDLVLVTIDTLRADRVGAYGDPLAQTPTLDGLAAKGALFRDAHSVTPLTLPSHASMLTGRYPVHHGLRDNGGFRLSDDVPTLAEALQAGGYTTGGFVSAFVLDGAWGLERGFDTYHDPFHPQRVAQVGAFGEVELPGAEVVNAALAWWSQTGKSEQPRFLWVHLYEPHTPWVTHPGWEGDPYRGEIAYTDTLVKRLLKATDTDDLVIVTSDHGEGLWDHGEREHGVLLGPSVTQVPLIIRPPGGLKGSQAPEPRARADVSERPDGIDATLDLTPVPDAPKAARVVEAPVSGVDIAPTLADYAGVPLPGVDGVSLRGLVDGGEPDLRAVYAETFFPLFHYGLSPLVMGTDGVQRIEEGVDARRTDPVTDRAGAAPETIDRNHVLRGHLDRLRGDETPQPGPIPGDQAAALEALGYLTRAAPTDGELADPRDAMSTLRELHAAEADPDPKAAIRRLEALVRANPDMVDAHIALSLEVAETGDMKRAFAITKDVLERWPDHPTALANGGFLARTLEEPDLALSIAQRMQVINPQDARGYRLEAAVLTDREDAVGLLDVTAKGLAVAPDDPNLHYLRALSEIEAGDPLAGVPHLLAARDNGTEARDIDLWLGVAHQRAGRIPEARQHFDAATRSMPGDPRPWAMAGVMLWKADLCKDALPYLINVARRGGGNDPQIRRAMAECDQAIKQERAKAKAQ